MNRFILAALAALITCNAIAGADLPLHAMYNALPKTKTFDALIPVLKELGYTGIAWQPGRDTAKTLAALRKAGLKMHSDCVVIGKKGDGLDLEGASSEIQILKGSGTTIWLNVQAKVPEEIVIKAIKDICDQARSAGLPVVLYPQVNSATDTAMACLNLVKKADKANLGLSFNLCEFLKQNEEKDLEQTLKAIRPYLKIVQVSGANSGDTRSMEWDQLIQPIGKGTFDMSKLVKLLRDVGYDGPVALQAFSIPGDDRDNLTQSIEAWYKLTGGNPIVSSTDAALYPYDKSATIKLSDKFKRVKAPGTGRQAVQLTYGKATCYPLYYFIPSLTKDLKYLVYHRAETSGGVQLYRLDLETGESIKLTDGRVPQTRWAPWCIESGPGILDHRSSLNVATDEVIYFAGDNGEKAYAVNLITLKQRHLFDITPGNYAAGQNCVTPDGKYCIYIEDPIGSHYKKPLGDKPGRIMSYHFATGEIRTVCEILDAHIHHVIPYNNDHLIFCHPPNGMGMLMTDMYSGSYEYLRDGDPGTGALACDAGSKGHICHFVTTARGIAYEVMAKHLSGIYNPFTRERIEFSLPDTFGYTHTGLDQEGRLWFWEDKRDHHMMAMTRLKDDGQGEFIELTGNWSTYGGGQKSHFHPQLTPDRKWIMFVGGDKDTRTNHIFLLGASDLKDTEGISPGRLSPAGESGVKAPKKTESGAVHADFQKTALELMQKAATWQLANLGKSPAGGWVMGPFWNGLMALGRIPGNESYIEKVAEVGNREKWRVPRSKWKANDHCTAQSYIDLYEIRHDPAMIAPTVKALDDYIAAAVGQDENLDFVSGNSSKWSWADALYMSPPTFAKLAVATGDRKYAEYLHKWWWIAADFYYDKEEKLYFRDQNMRKITESNGKKLFWSRGNGWVIGGLVRVLQCLPKDDAMRPRYVEQFKEMCEKLVEIQCADGLWRSGLLDAAAYPDPEASGSGFFVYALAYGVNEGLLDKSEFQPAALKGWKGLESCVTPDGRFQHVQPVGDRPGRFPPDTTAPYGTGAFLLAGSEVFRMMAAD